MVAGAAEYASELSSMIDAARKKYSRTGHGFKNILMASRPFANPCRRGFDTNSPSRNGTASTGSVQLPGNLFRRLQYGPFLRNAGQGIDVFIQGPVFIQRSEEHTSELQSRQYLVC